VRYQLFAAVKMDIPVFWVMTPYSLVGSYHCFGRTCCLHYPGGVNGVIAHGNAILIFKENLHFIGIILDKSGL
jgi:hypothetical protein